MAVIHANEVPFSCSPANHVHITFTLPTGPFVSATLERIGTVSGLTGGSGSQEGMRWGSAVAGSGGYPNASMYTPPANGADDETWTLDGPALAQVNLAAGGTLDCIYNPIPSLLAHTIAVTDLILVLNGGVTAFGHSQGSHY